MAADNSNTGQCIATSYGTKMPPCSCKNIHAMPTPFNSDCVEVWARAAEVFWTVVIAGRMTRACMCMIWASRHVRQHASSGAVVCFVCHLQDDQGIVTHYVGIQTDVSKAADMLQTPQALQEQQAAGA
jgi:hypothetical protein